MNSVFLVGCPRSGTTLLQSMIASHPRVLSFPETHFFSSTIPINPLLRRFKLYGPGDASVINEFLTQHHYSALLSAKGLSAAGQTHHRWCQRLMEVLNEMAGQDAQQAKVKPRWWLEKTPRHLHYISSIEATNRTPRFLHILREGKHVVASLHLATKNHPEEWDGERTVRKCIKWWKKDISVSVRHAHRPNHFLVVYDQLISAPEKVLKKICEFLGLEFEDEMLTRFHQTADQLTTEEEQWKSRNRQTALSSGNKLQKHFEEETIRYITRKTQLVDLSPYYIT